MTSGFPSAGHRTYSSPVDTFADLPTTGVTTNTVKLVDDTGILYQWNGSAWIPIRADATAGSVGAVSGLVLNDVACDSTVYVSAAVRISAGLAVNALADSIANSNIIGIVESKSSSTLCNIRVLGVSATVFLGLDPTYEYFLSDTVDGAITTTVPSLPDHVILKVGQPFSATELLVLKGTRIVRS